MFSENYTSSDIESIEMPAEALTRDSREIEISRRGAARLSAVALSRARHIRAEARDTSEPRRATHQSRGARHISVSANV